MNPLFNMLGGGQTPNVLGNFGNIVQAFQQFRNGFRGNAMQQVQTLMNSGRYNQQQYNQAVQMANQLQQMLNK